MHPFISRMNLLPMFAWLLYKVRRAKQGREKRQKHRERERERNFPASLVLLHFLQHFERPFGGILNLGVGMLRGLEEEEKRNDKNQQNYKEKF
tara:strand:+ start:193 stop:471 length:279 start_codon:yes stop_codon:yes gene_type:complete